MLRRLTKLRFWLAGELLMGIGLMSVGCSSGEPFEYVKASGNLSYENGDPIESASTTIPEPSAAGLAALAGLLFWTVRRPLCN